MNLLMFSVFDSKAKVFSKPFFMRTLGEASRMFADAVNAPAKDNPWAAHPEDYTLFHLADFSDDDGAIFPLSAKTALANGIAVREPPSSTT